MEFNLFALLLVAILDELGWSIQSLQDEEDAQADMAYEMAYEQWLKYHDYPDHW